MNKNLINYDEVIKSSGIHEFFSQNTFCLCDSQNQELAGRESSQAKSSFPSVKVIVNKEHYFNIFCDEMYQSSIVKILQKSILRIGVSLQSESWLFQNQVITDDLISILSDAENILIPLNEILAKIIRSLQSHALCENILFFTCDQGHTLKLRESINEVTELDEFFLAAQTVANLKEIVLSNQVNEDVELTKIFQSKLVNSILVFPIIHEGILLGVFQLVNTMQSDFSQNDVDLVRRFSRFTGHILKEKYQNDQVLQKESVTIALGQYLSRNVFEKIKSEGQEDIGGTRKNIVVLFCLIQNFKRLYASLPPSALHKFLNFYYDQMHRVVENHQGTLDKIITPACMAVWNHPVEQADCQDLAINCAHEMMQTCCERISPLMLKNKFEHFSIGIGLNYGPAVAGNIGSQDFLDYTVIGDTINTGQRLEANAGKNEILISDKYYRDVFGELREVDKLKEIKAKGKSQIVKAISLKSNVL
ncbi:GAF domain-containing protein [Bacteriovoracaceae bacterium]|nr:GAF domain-containing protein [Bacteriovoracaceae bacterium]